MSCEFATLDGAYVLGSLSPAERADYERHLRTCDDCARSVRELAGLPGLLARVPADVLEHSADREPVPATLLPALVAVAERQQRRRTIRTALLAAAAVAVIAGGTAVVAAALDDEESPPTSFPSVTVETTAPPQEMTAVGDGKSEGWVSLTPEGMGTRLDLTCEYQSSYGGGHAYKYTLVVYATDGRVQDAPRFKASSGEERQVSGTVSIAPDEIDKVVVENSYGDVILLLTP